MPLAKDVAAELRKLADSLDTIGEVVFSKPFLHISHSEKGSFVAVAKVMPRPWTKDVAYPGERFAERRLKYSGSALNIWNCVPQSLTCELIESAKPAVYRCDPILSSEEDAELEVANG